MILLNGREVKPTIFPDGTSQVWHLDKPSVKRHSCAQVEWRFESEAEFLHLAQLKMLLSAIVPRVSLYMPYLPYARQDKHIDNDLTFALETFAMLLNLLEFDRITVFDPHSNRAGEFIENLYVEYPVEIVHTLFKVLKADFVCYPDKGAADKYDSMMDLPAIHGAKVRDQATGRITEYKLMDHLGRVPEICKDFKTVLIVDDICDGGATFILLAKALKDAGVEDINLYVSHGLFTKGKDILFKAGIRAIYTKEGQVW